MPQKAIISLGQAKINNEPWIPKRTYLIVIAYGKGEVIGELTSQGIKVLPKVRSTLDWIIPRGAEHVKKALREYITLILKIKNKL